MKEFSQILKSVVTEKSSIAQVNKKYTFIVSNSATKVDIKKAIKAIYGVEADNVQTLICPKKVRLVGRGRLLVKRPLCKKAIVTLKGNKTIDINKFKESKTKK